VGIEDIFSPDGAAGQLLIWNVFGQVLGSLMSPGLSLLQQLVNEAAVAGAGGASPTPLSPADAADAVVRGFLTAGDGAGFAAQAGVSGDDFSTLVSLAGDAPSPTDLIAAYRRRLIPLDAGSPDAAGVKQGIAQGRLADKWLPMIEGLGDLPIGIADAVDAYVEGQISLDQAQQIAYVNGLSAENLAILINTRGNPPDITTLAELVRRGVIDVDGTGPDALTFVQGISEGATKDKWITPLKSLLTVIPPVSTVEGLQRVGTITGARALEYYKQLGVDDYTAADYVQAASTDKTTVHKQVAESDVVALYQGGGIDAPTAVTMLEALGYEANEASEILSIYDFHRAVSSINAAVTKVRSYYVARKVDNLGAVNALNALGVPPDQQQQLIALWGIEQSDNVKLLTGAEIVDAWYYQVISQDVALAELQGIGYSPQDAYILLSNKNKGPLPATAVPPATTITG
jgi:hypothetical protein